MKHFLTHVPGFRTNILWKKIIAIISYLFMIIILSISDGFTIGDKVLSFIQFFLIFALLLIMITNMGGIRSKLPLFKRKRKLNIPIGFIIVFICITIIIGVIDQFYSPEYKESTMISLKENSDKKLADKKAIEDKNKITKDKAIEDKKLADDKAIEEKKIVDAKSDADKKIEEDKAIEDKKIADAKSIEEKKINDQKEIEDKKIADAKAIEDANIAKENDYKVWIESQFSGWDGSHMALVKLIKPTLNDKKSFQHDKTTYTDTGNSLIVKMTYRAKNSFGALILQNVTATSDYETNTITVISQND